MKYIHPSKLPHEIYPDEIRRYLRDFFSIVSPGEFRSAYENHVRGAEGNPFVLHSLNEERWLERRIIQLQEDASRNRNIQDAPRDLEGVAAIEFVALLSTGIWGQSKNTALYFYSDPKYRM